MTRISYARVFLLMFTGCFHAPILILRLGVLFNLTHSQCLLAPQLLAKDGAFIDFTVDCYYRLHPISLMYIQP